LLKIKAAYIHILSRWVFLSPQLPSCDGLQSQNYLLSFPVLKTLPALDIGQAALPILIRSTGEMKQELLAEAHWFLSPQGFRVATGSAFMEWPATDHCKRAGGLHQAGG
jgi:hypothetical protein